MKYKFKKLLILSLIILLLIPNTSLAISTSALQSKQSEPDLLFFIDVFQYIKDKYPFEIENKDLMEGALKGMLQSIDPYSDYYTPEETIDLYKDMLGTFSGIGVYIEEKDSYINIIDVIKNSPAEKAGLKKGDIIISIDDKDIKGITVNEASRLIKGPIGTKVKLGIIRESNNLPTLPQLYIDVIRGTVNINPVEYKVIENNIGYIKLSEFSQSSAKEMKKALDSLDKAGIHNIILDLRNNPGGLLDQVIEISKNFIPKGPIVHIKEKNKDLVTYISTLDKPKFKLVVLVNEYSASASEIFAGAVKDTKAGTIIGTKTFGKGIVQTLLPISNGGLVKLTTAYYLTPNLNYIHGSGIQPDMIVENKGEVDEQLKAAIKQFK